MDLETKDVPSEDMTDADRLVNEILKTAEAMARVTMLQHGIELPPKENPKV